MKTITLLLFVVITLACAANRRRYEVLFPDLGVPTPKPEKHVMNPMISAPLNILLAINTGVRRGDGMLIHTNYTFPTEVVISKCGKPMLLIFEAKTVTGIISDEDVNTISDSYNYYCNEGDENAWITFTAKSDPDVEGNTMFTAGYEKEDFGPVKIHNVSAPVISKVDFSLPPYQLNKWPIKIGRLLREASKPNNQLVLFVDSVTPVHFYFSKCGFAAKRIPSTIDRSFMLNATQINSLKIIYNKKCGKPWLDGIIELELIADRAHTRGTFEIKLVKDSEPMESLEQKAEEEEEQPSIEIIAIRLVLVSLLIVVICCAGILIHNTVFLFPNYYF